MHGAEKHLGAVPPPEEKVVEFKTFEDAALAAKMAWDQGEFDRAAQIARAARTILGDKGRVIQMPNGALQVVPNE